MRILVPAGRLRAGSRVAVVAPSGRNDPAVVADGCRLLADWGLDVRVAPHALAGHDDLGYLAGADTDRAADLQQAWLDPAIEAVLSARGGYGAQRIVDRLDWAAMAAAPPKTFTGFSDITALHEAFALRLGVPTLHAPNVGSDSFTAFPEAQRSLQRALFEPDRPDARVLAWDGADRLVPGRAACLTAGGNLSLLAAGLARRTAGRPRAGRPGRPGADSPAASCCSRTCARSATGWTGCSPSCCAPGHWTASRGSRWAAGPAAGPPGRSAG